MDDRSIQELKQDYKPFVDHLKELRYRILLIFVVFVIFFFLSYPITPYFIQFVKSSASRQQIDLHLFKLTESVSIYIKTMIFQSISYSFPFIALQIYLFVKPALSARTRKTVLIVIPIIAVLFLAGAYIGLTVFVPLLFSFFLAVSQDMGIEAVFGFADYYDFVFITCLVFGLILEMPVFLGFLTYIGVITPTMLRKARRFVYPLLCLFGVAVTPPDFVSDIVVTSALFLMFEISIIICKWVFESFDFHHSNEGLTENEHKDDDSKKTLAIEPAQGRQGTRHLFRKRRELLHNRVAMGGGIKRKRRMKTRRHD